MSNNASQELRTTAFTAISTEGNSPVVQISAKYHRLGGLFTLVDEGASGSFGVTGGMYECQTGVAADGLAVLLSDRYVSNRPGQGMFIQFNALFDVGVDGSDQRAGLITSENQLCFGYAGAAFGIFNIHDGQDAIHDLVITTPAAGAETATVTVNSIAYSVPLTTGTVQHNAWEIAESLTSQIGNYSFTSNDDTVTAVSTIAFVDGTFAFTSATAVATWSLISAGLEPTVSFIPQASWNVDTRISADPLESLDPLLGNEYAIQYQGAFGDIGFFVVDNNTGNLVLVHVIRYSNTDLTPNVNNPSFRIGWAVRNSGNTTNLTIKGQSASGFIEGEIIYPIPGSSFEHDQLSVGVAPTNIIAFRNRNSINGIANRSEIFPGIFTLTTQTTKSAFFELIIDPVFVGDLDFQYVDKENSIMEIATEPLLLVGGTSVSSRTVTDSTPQDMAFNQQVRFISAIRPGRTYALVARVTAAPASDMQATGNWAEDT